MLVIPHLHPLASNSIRASSTLHRLSKRASHPVLVVFSSQIHNAAIDICTFLQYDPGLDLHKSSDLFLVLRSFSKRYIRVHPLGLEPSKLFRVDSALSSSLENREFSLANPRQTHQISIG